MRSIDGQWALEVTADGVDLQLDPSVLGSFNAINNIHQHLPTLNYSFKDDTGRWLDNLIRDGASLQVKIGQANDYYTIPYTVMGQPDFSDGQLTVRAAYAKLNWLRKVVDKPYQGNASDVIKQLAQEVGLEVEADGTQDSMNWLPNRTTLAQYARHVTDRAFSGAGSALLLAVTETGKLRFKDLNKLIDAGATKTFASDPGAGEHHILAYGVTSKAHVTNSSQGYGSTSIGVNEDGSIFEGNRVAVKLLGQATSVSSFVQGLVGDLGTRIRPLAPLSGNTHEHWNEAIHQNERVKSTYAYDIELLVDRPAHVELLDVVKLRPFNPQTGREARSLVGNYIVTAMTKTIFKNRFLEKIVVTSQGAGGV